ncbi:MAG: hypothetical protein AABN95_26680 [Acidobacteriota bacterium]
MGFASLLRKGAGALAKVGKIPGVGMIPGVGNVLSGVSTAAALYGGYKALTAGSGGGGGGGGMPPGMGGMPALPGMQSRGQVMPMPGQTGGFGVPRGPGGGMQMPWRDPAIPEYLKQFALDDQFLRPYVRAPRGYVLVRDASGRPFAVLKSMAKAFKMWRPKPKPPISVRDWHHLKGAGRVVDKLKDMEKTAKKIANFHAPRAAKPTKKGK